MGTKRITVSRAQKTAAQIKASRSAATGRHVSSATKAIAEAIEGRAQVISVANSIRNQITQVPTPVHAIAQKVAGFSLGQADILRRAMDKKKKSELDKQYEGLRKKGMSKSRAAAIANAEGASSRGGK